MSDGPRRPCNVSGANCIAPAGYANSVGWAHGDKSCRGTCDRCGEPVCGKCSKRRPVLFGKRRTVCFTCQEDPNV